MTTSPKIQPRPVPLIDHMIVWVCGILFCLLPLVCVLVPRAFGTIVPAGFLLFYGLVCFQQRRLILPCYGMMGIVGLILGLCFASSLWSIAPDQSLERAGKITGILIPCILGVSAIRQIPPALQQRLYRLFKPMFFCISISIIILMVEYLAGHFFYRAIRNIPLNAPLAHSVSNHGAIILSLLIFPAMFYLLTKHRKNLAITMFLCSLLVIAFFSRSETALVALIIGGGTWVASRYLPRFTFISVTSVAMILPFVMTCLSEWVFKHFAPLLTHWRHANAAPRLEIWDFVSRYAMSNPWFGHGIEAARNINDFDNQKIYFTGNSILHPHNGLLQVWIEFGLLGVVVLVLLISTCLIRISKLSGICRHASLSLFTACFTVGLIGYGLWQGWWLGLMFVCIASYSLIKQQRELPQGS